MKNILLSAFLLMPSLSFASGISSNGGKIITYEENPWFVGEGSVNYCIDIDQQNFSTTAENIRFEIDYAINDWVQTIDQLQTMRRGETRLLKTDFVYQNRCTENTDLHFLLGSMTEKVKEIIKNSGNQYVAFAERTQYDEVTNSSKGYIWIAPDKGPNSYKDINRSVWAGNPFVHFAVMHELGHVFGLNHERGNFMASRFPESMADSFVLGQTPEIHENIYLIPAGFELRLTRDLLLGAMGSLNLENCSFLFDERDLDYKETLSKIFNYPNVTDEHSVCLRSKVIYDGDSGRDIIWKLQLVRKVRTPEMRVFKTLTFRSPRYSHASPTVLGKYKSENGEWKNFSVLYNYVIQGKPTKISNGIKDFATKINGSNKNISISFSLNNRVVDFGFRISDSFFIVKKPGLR